MNQKTAKRDPRTDPDLDDILRKETGHKNEKSRYYVTRKVSSLGISHNNITWVGYHQAPFVRERSCSLVTWRRWAKTAVIIEG